MDEFKNQSIAIVGVAFRLPGNISSIDTLWNALSNGEHLVTEVDNTRFPTKKYFHPRKSEPKKAYTFKAGLLSKLDEFDAAFFGISPREANQMDPQQRMLLELTWEALENANQKPETLAGSKCGVFVGIANSEHLFKCNNDIAIDSHTMLGNCNSIASNRISYVFDWHGPSFSVDTACSSSMVALHQACQSIRNGESSSAVVGGINLLLSPAAFIGFSKASMLSPDGSCKSFDKDANGYVRSEGCIVLYLKPLKAAVDSGDPIHGVILNTGINSDGRTNGIALPSAVAQTNLISQVHSQINLSADDISYVEAHGTGTPAGDPIETQAIGDAIGKHRSHDKPLLIGSIKSNIGHLEVASGLAGILKAILCFKYKTIPATIHFKNPNPNIDFQNLRLSVVDGNAPLPKGKNPAIIAVNSFGFGGANGHVVLSEYVTLSKKMEINLIPPLLFSARNEASFSILASEYHALLRKQPNSYYDVAYTLARRRSLHDKSLVIHGDSLQTIMENLEKIKQGDARILSVVEGKAIGKQLLVALVYSGNGSQWQGMGQQLIQQEPLFEKWIDEVDLLFSKHSNFSIKSKILASAENSQYHLTEIAQPCLFALQVAITKYLIEKGVVIKAVLGHSIGEVTAAWASGALTLSQAVDVIYHRSFWQGKTRGHGKMAAVALSSEDTKALLQDLDLSHHLAISAINSPKGVTLAGDLPFLENLKSTCDQKNIFCTILDLDYAFHSKYMDAIQQDLLASLSTLKPSKNPIRYVSTVEGKTIDGDQLDAHYWWRNIREPVKFYDAMDELITEGISLFIEVGPHPVLKRYVDDCLAHREANGLVLTTMKRSAGALEEVQSALFKTWMSGAEFNLDYFFPIIGNHITLPLYPWIKEKYWLKPTNENTDQCNLDIEHPLLGYRIKIGEPIWENHLDTTMVSYLADHVVSGMPVMPAAGYAEMALAAAKIWYRCAQYDVRDIEILSPMVFDDTICKLVHFSLQPDEGLFQIKSRSRQSDEAWLLHAMGRIHPEPAYIPKQKSKIAPRKLQKKAPLDSKERLYARAEKLGLSYGPIFQSIENVWVQGEYCLATIKLHPAVIEEQEQYSLHPALLDACFQLLATYENKKHEMILPVRIGRLKITGKFDNDLMITCQIVKQNKQSVLAHFSILDKNNDIIAEISDCRFKNVYSDNQFSPAKQYICKPHILTSNQKTGFNIALISPIRDEVEKTILTMSGTSSEHFQTMMPLIDLLIGQFVYQTIKKMVDAKKNFSIDDLCAQAKIIPSQRLLLKICLNILIEDSYIQTLDENHFNFVSQEDVIDPIATWDVLLRDYPGYLRELLEVGRSGFHLGDILNGKKSPSKIFPVSDNGSEEKEITKNNLVLITTAIKALLKKWPFSKSRLRVLEVCHHPSNLALHLLNTLSYEKADYCLAVTDDYHFIKAKTIAEGYPSLKVAQLDLTASIADQLTAIHSQFDLVIIRNELNHRFDFEKMLSELNKIMDAKSVLVIEDCHHDRMVEFVSAVKNNHVDSNRLSPTGYQQLLMQTGFDIAEPLSEPGASECEGAFLIMAQRIQDKTKKAAPQGNQWLVITDDQQAIEPIITALKVKQKSILMGTIEKNSPLSFNPNKIESVKNLLTPFQVNPNKLHIVLVMGLNAFKNKDDNVPLCFVQNGFDIIMNLLKSIQELAWDVFPQLTVITQGGALCDTNKNISLSKNPEHGALWGLGRVLMNEHPEFHCRLIDMQGDLSAQLSKHLIHELLYPHRENEIIITDSAVYGLHVNVAETAPSLKNNHSTFRLDFVRPGPLKNLQWFPIAKSKLAKDEVAVKPHASGLNFRDVMYSMGLIPDEAVEDGFLGQTLGMEFAGEIIAIGSEVAEFSVGDKVMGFAPASFSSYAVTKAYAVTPLPDRWSYSAGASIPIAFFTAYYALTHLARMQPGERLLVHGAAGGVGIAAIQLAKQLGVEIHATAGSDEKRDFLTLLGIRYIYNSRGLAFADQILEKTNGDGIDVVLNCLAGEAIHANLSIMRPFGRFLELGKRDFYANSKIGLRPFRNNISYFGIDADQLIVKNPTLSNRLFKEMFSLFNEGVLSPLPYCEFSPDHIHDAFRYMQQSRQIGKIIVNFSQSPSTNFAKIQHDKKLNLNPNATYLLTGGLNGFGFRTAQWLVEKGARHLVLIGRSGVSSETVQSAITDLENQGVNVRVTPLDITDRDALNSLLSSITNDMPPLKGIFHAAAVYDDAIFMNLTSEKVSRVLEPKLQGAWNLHQAVLAQPISLDYFVVYSSVTTLLGNPGQSNYVAANAFLENLIYLRRANQLPGFYVAWGAIEDVGYLARNTNVKESLVSKMGMSVLTAKKALDALEQLLLEQNSHAGAIISDLNIKTIKRLSASGSSKFSLLISNADNGDTEYDEKQLDIHQKIADGTLTETTVINLLAHEIGKILYISPEKIDVNESLTNMGMDSLMGVELANAIEQSFGVTIPILALSQNPTISKLAKNLFSQLSKPETSETTDIDKEMQTMVKLAEQHGETVINIVEQLTC